MKEINLTYEKLAEAMNRIGAGARLQDAMFSALGLSKPEKKKVKLLAYLVLPVRIGEALGGYIEQGYAHLELVAEGTHAEPHWRRVPSEDKEVEVEGGE